MALTLKYPDLPKSSKLSVGQTAEVLGTSRQTVYNYIKAGKLSPMDLTKDRKNWKIKGEIINRFWQRQ